MRYARFLNLMVGVWVIFYLVGCGAGQTAVEPTAESLSATTAVGAPVAVEEVMTPTAQPSFTPAAMVEPTATASIEPVLSETITPTPSSSNEEKSIRATAVLPLDELINGRIRQLLPGGNNSVWVVADGTAIRWQNGAVDQIIPNLPGRFLGEDTAHNLIWATTVNNGIVAWDGANWLSDQVNIGWAPFDSIAPVAVYSGINDANGRFWVATNSDLRFFDGERWEQITPKAMGLENIVADDRWLNLTLLPAQNGDVWVGTCHVSPPGPTGGQGVRIYQNDRWETVVGLPESGCVRRLEGDPAGALWLNFDGDLWHRPEPAADWSGFGPPAPEFGTYGTVADLSIDAEGGVWALSVICGGASCGTMTTLFYFAGGEWTAVPDWTFSAFGENGLFVVPEGAVWAVADSQLSLITTAPIAVAEQRQVIVATQTEDGRIWFVAEDGEGVPTLFSLFAE